MSRRRTAATCALALTALTCALVPAAATAGSAGGRALVPAPAAASPTPTQTPCPTFTRVAPVPPGRVVWTEKFEDSYVGWTQGDDLARPRPEADAGRTGKALAVRNLAAGPLTETVTGTWYASGDFTVSLFVRLGAGTPRTAVKLRVLAVDGGAELAAVSLNARSTRWIKLSRRYNPGSERIAYICNGQEINPWHRAKPVQLELTAVGAKGPVPVYLDDVSIKYLGGTASTTRAATPTP